MNTTPTPDNTQASIPTVTPQQDAFQPTDATPVQQQATPAPAYAAPAQQYAQPGQYSAPAQQYAAPVGQPATSTESGALSLTSFILGIASIVMGWTFFAPIAGIILGIIGRKKEQKNRTLGLWGIILSSVMLVLSVIIIIVFFTFFAIALPFAAM